MRHLNERNVNLIYSSRTQDRILDRRILRFEVLTYCDRFLVAMAYSGYIKDHPAYCLNHKCRKFHVLKYIIIERKFQALSWQEKIILNQRPKKKNPIRQIKYQCWHVSKHTRPWGGLFIFAWGIYEAAAFLIQVSSASHVCRNYSIIYGLAYCIQTQQTILELKERQRARASDFSSNLKTTGSVTINW